MTQMSFSDAEYAGKRKQTRRETLLVEMEQVVPRETLLARVEPVYPKAGNGRRPYPTKTMQRIHLLQNWFGYSDPAMEEALYQEKRGQVHLQSFEFKNGVQERGQFTYIRSIV